MAIQAMQSTVLEATSNTDCKISPILHPLVSGFFCLWHHHPQHTGTDPEMVATSPDLISTFQTAKAGKCKWNKNKSS